MSDVASHSDSALWCSWRRRWLFFSLSRPVKTNRDFGKRAPDFPPARNYFRNFVEQEQPDRKLKRTVAAHSALSFPLFAADHLRRVLRCPPLPDLVAVVAWVRAHDCLVNRQS